MRINKYLAHRKYATRKGGDELVANGKVFINGKRAVLGDKVHEHDVVEVKQKGAPKKYVYYAYNKPKGVITHSPQNGEEDIRQALPHLKNVFHVGRLDKNSYGLIILTNDGRITDPLLNPAYDHDKEYVVSVKEVLRPSFEENIEKGVKIDDYTTRPCTVNVINDHRFSITLTEGKKHQIRRMCETLHLTVTDLKRVRILNISLGKLLPGEYRPIAGKELDMFLSNLGFDRPQTIRESTQ